MKKTICLFVVFLFAVGAHAQTAGKVGKGRLERQVQAQVNASAQSSAVEPVIKAFELFKTRVASHKYYEWNVIFQLMEDTRDAYMKLHGGDPAVVKPMAEYLARPVRIDQGAQEITIPDYVRMESISLYKSEREKFDEFEAALEADLELDVAQDAIKTETKLERAGLDEHFTQQDISNAQAALPAINAADAAGKQIKANMYYPVGLEDKQAIGNIFQSFSRTVEEYNQLHGSNIEAARMAATYISQKVFTTKDGKIFNVIDFISQFEAAYPSTPGGFDDFKDNLRNDAAESSITVLK